MELRQLEAFVCVMECGSFSRAAERMYLGQPTISAHVAALESEMSVKLFIRTTKELHPTEEGRLLYEYATRMLTIRRDALEAVRMCACEKQGRVVVAASSIPVYQVLPALLGEFNMKYPHINVELRALDSRSVVREVTEHRADVGFCGTRIRSTKCAFEPIAEDRLVLLAPNRAKYRRYEKGGFPVRQLEQEAFISREKGSGTREETEAFLKEMGVDPQKLHIVAEIPSNEQIKELVRVGGGLAVLSRSVLRENAEGLLSFDFSNTRLRRKLYILCAKNERLSSAAETFYAFSREYARRNRYVNREENKA